MDSHFSDPNYLCLFQRLIIFVLGIGLNENIWLLSVVNKYDVIVALTNHFQLRTVVLNIQ